MEINKLIEIVKEKISKNIILQEINVEDKSFKENKIRLFLKNLIN